VGFLLESYINSSMAKTIFDPLKDLQGGQQRATTWYRNAVSLIADILQMLLGHKLCYL
jgi:hypothetical protein